MTRGAPAPIFIVGSPRSGTSILTWSIGQHPNVLALEETAWMGPITSAVAVAHASGSARGERSQLSAMGITRETLLEAFGVAIHGVVVGHRDRFEELALASATREPSQVNDTVRISRGAEEPKRRWVDGTPENSFWIYELSLLFPGAQFIHLVRDARSVARSLVHFHTIGGARYTADAAYREWLRSVRECLNAERALGSDRVSRIRYGGLIENREATVRQILRLIGESYTERCVEALGKRINSSEVPPNAIVGEPDTALRDEIDAISASLFDPDLRYEPGQQALADVERRFQRRSFGPGLSANQMNLVRQTMPRDARVIVASGGDDNFLDLDGRTGWHYPQNSIGACARVDALSDESLIQQVERLRGSGAGFLLIPAGPGDALAARSGFIEYLAKFHIKVASAAGVGDIWSLEGVYEPEPSAEPDSVGNET